MIVGLKYLKNHVKNRYHLSIIVFFLSTILVQAQPTAKLNVDWQQFLAMHDMVWNKMPNDYYEGPFVGNGLLGTILFKDKKRT